MVSLGEAISLQGRNTIAEQIGKMSFQADEAGKNRALKAGVEAGESAKDQQKAILDLFKQKGEYHRLVVPKAQELATRTFQEMAKIKASGTPYASNQYAQLNQKVYNDFIELQSESEQLKAFDNQLKTTDYSKKFFGYGFSKFLPAYQNAKSLEDLRKLRDQDPAIGRTLNFVLDDRGIPSVIPRDAIQYEQDLKSRVSALVPNKLKVSSTNLDNAYGSKVVTNTGIVPLTNKEAEEIVKLNPELANRGVISVESVVDDYLDENPSLIEQIADQANIPYNAVPGSRLPDDATIDKVREYLMKAAAPYAKTRQTSQLVYPPGARGGTGAPEPTKEDLISEGSVRTFNYGGTPSTYTSANKVEFSGSEPAKDFTADNTVTQVGKVSGLTSALPQAKLAAMEVLPYTLDGTIKRPIPDGNTAAKAGYHTFVLFNTTTNAVYADIDRYTPASIASMSKAELNTVLRQTRLLKQIADEKSKK